jgi:hypothetical protein
LGHLRPARRFEGADGREWELYVLRFELPEWRPGGDADDDEASWSWRTGSPLRLLLAPFFLVSHVLVPLARVLVLLPWRALRSRGATSVIVEAVTFAPIEERYRWRTTADQAQRVLIQIEGQLERGEHPEPVGAQFLGAAR